MDRDTRWDRVELAYEALAYGQGHRGRRPGGVAAAYARGVNDEFVLPTIVPPEQVARVRDGDVASSSISARTAHASSPGPSPSPASTVSTARRTAVRDFVTMTEYEKTSRCRSRFRRTSPGTCWPRSSPSAA